MHITDEEKDIIDFSRKIHMEKYTKVEKILLIFKLIQIGALIIISFWAAKYRVFSYLLLVIIVINFFRGLNSNATQRKLYKLIYKLTENRSR